MIRTTQKEIHAENRTRWVILALADGAHASRLPGAGAQQNHFPAHVHVIKAGTYAKVRIGGNVTVYETNMSKRDFDAAKSIVAAQLDRCRKEWIARYGSLSLKPKTRQR